MTTQTDRQSGERLRRVGTLELRAGADGDSVDVAFSSQTTEVRSWLTGAPEILLHEPGSADLGGLRSALLNHDPGKILGRVERARIDTRDRRGRASIRFDADPDAQRAAEKVRSGSLAGVSVGFSVTAWKLLEPGQSWRSPGGQEFSGPADIATAWRAYEISLTPIPADSSVGVGRSADLGPEGPVKRNGGPVPDTAPDPTANVAPAAAVAAERRRAAEIRQIVGSFRDVPEVRALEADLLDGDATVEEARGRIFDALARVRAPVNVPGRAGIELVVDSKDKFTRDCADSLLIRAGVVRDDRRAGEITHFGSLGELARECLRQARVSTAGMRPAEIARRALSHSTSDFPAILENVANKSMQTGWEESPETWRPLVRVVPAPDFKPMSRVALGDFGGLELKLEGGKMAEGSIPEAKKAYSIATYAKRFGITRETIVNDDMAALSDVPRKMGQAAKRLIADTFYSLLTSASGVGPTIAEDNVALFSASHASGSNYTAAAGSPDATGLAVGRKLMRLQKGLAATGETPPILNIAPRFLLVPAALETDAAKTLNSVWLPGAQNETSNPFYKAAELIVEPRLDGATNGATAWYLAADPNVVTGAEIAFLDGQEAPTLVREDDTRILGVELGIYLDVGMAFIGHRGWYRCRGA